MRTQCSGPKTCLRIRARKLVQKFKTVFISVEIARTGVLSGEKVMQVLTVDMHATAGAHVHQANTITKQCFGSFQFSAPCSSRTARVRF